MPFRIAGLDPAPFRHLYGLSDAELATHGARRYRVSENPGFPDRIELRDLAIGEAALLVNYTHQPLPTPYRASHAIFVCEGADRPAVFENEVPEVLARRPLSVRGFDAAGMMTDAALIAGTELAATIERMFTDAETCVLQIHNAVRGCYAAQAVRM